MGDAAQRRYQDAFERASMQRLTRTTERSAAMIRTRAEARHRVALERAAATGKKVGFVLAILSAVVLFMRGQVLVSLWACQLSLLHTHDPALFALLN